MSCLTRVGLTAHLTNMFLVNFAVRADVLRQHVPPVFALETKDGYGFMSAVIARVEAMRPRGAPKLLGRDFDSVVYRVPVRYRSNNGRTVRGFYFPRSDASDWLLSLGGFWQRLFKTCWSHVAMMQRHGETRFTVVPSDFSNARIAARFVRSRRHSRLPESSCFATIQQADEFLIARPIALHYDSRRREVAIVLVRRAHWNARVASVQQAEFDYVRALAGRDPQAVRFDSVLYVQRVPYVWHPPIFENRPDIRESLPEDHSPTAEMLGVVRKLRTGGSLTQRSGQ